MLSLLCCTPKLSEPNRRGNSALLCAGFVVASLVFMSSELQDTGLWSGNGGLVVHHMQHFPGPGINRCPLHYKLGFLTTVTWEPHDYGLNIEE